MTVHDSFKIDTQAFESMQTAFFKCTHTYGFCMDLDGARITPFFCSDEVENFFGEHVTSEMERGMIATLNSGYYEDVIRMDTGYPGVLLGGIAIRDRALDLVGVMVVMGARITEDEEVSGISTTTEVEYESALTLASILISQYCKQKNEGVTLAQELEREKESSTNLEVLLKKSELITSILKRMESDNDFPKVSEAILSDVGEYLEASNAFLLRLSPDELTVDMISEWTAEDATAFLPDFVKVERASLPFFSGRPYTVSSDAVLPEDFSDYFKKYDITAGVFLPLFISERLGMYVCFTISGKKRSWTPDELLILNDVKRIMQTILTKSVTKNSLASSYAVLDAILENTGCGVCVRNDETGELLYKNELFIKMLYDMQDMEEFDRFIRTHTGTDRTEYYLIHANIRCDVSFVPIRWVDGRPVTLCTLYDVTALYDSQKKLMEQAVTDSLTGLKNRASFLQEIDGYIRDAMRSEDDGYYIYIDLDEFKDINFRLGHSAGDEVLMQVADVIKMIVRGRGEVYRLGDDEFAVVIPQQISEAQAMIDSISHRFTREFKLSTGSCFCKASIAVVRFPTFGSKAGELMHNADSAMWTAKSAGVGVVEYYDGELDYE
ncbi:MAG: GGDEF domain-containing protein [Lachnospiraceae bacterium]|nr:GGDEF domain-containing protein [Lachnospiraceae bacterium]